MKAKILVVDDEPDLEALIVQKFRRAIREGTMSFVFARDGVDALARIGEHKDIDMVLSDINMPRMDGLTLLAELQKSDEKLSTVIVSAYGDMANIRTAMNRGAFDFLTKPIDFSDLEVTLDKTVRHIEIQREANARQASAERAHAALSRFFSPSLAERLASDTASCDLSGQRRDISVIFTDVAGFTSLVETLDPAILGPLLNEYLGEMTDIVFAHDGTVTKIVGDALHVLFGAPADQHDHASLAIECSLALDACSQAFRARWSEKGIAIGVTRIGINAGTALVGNFGGGRFFDYTAYGDTINTASRLEVANKQLGTRICASDSVVQKVQGFRGRPIGDLVLRGRSVPLRVFHPLTQVEFDAPGIQAYLAAFAKLEAADISAMPAFAALVGACPDDPLANFHLRRLLNGQKGARIEMD